MATLNKALLGLEQTQKCFKKLVKHQRRIYL